MKARKLVGAEACHLSINSQSTGRTGSKAKWRAWDCAARGSLSKSRRFGFGDKTAIKEGTSPQQRLGCFLQTLD